MIWSRTYPGKSQKPSSKRSRPQVELLEDRLVPSSTALAPSALSEPQQVPAAVIGALHPGHPVPLRGSLTARAVSAVPTADPNVLLVTTVGSGQATQLGSFTFVSPHLTNLVTLQVQGTQTLTFSDGTITGSFSSHQVHIVEATGHVAGHFPVFVTGGTGRFEGASGVYIFEFDFDPATLTSTATIHGQLVFASGHGSA